MDLVLFEEIAIEAGKTGTVTDAQIQSIRRNIYPDSVVSRYEAEGLYAIERARRSHSDAWSELFVSGVAQYVLSEAPVGYVSAENAAWLQDQIGRRKQPTTDGDVALIAKIIEDAREVPPAFAAFALRLAKDAVIYGDGRDAHGSHHAPGRVTDADITMLQRILWGAGSEGHLAISREEAEALFAIADATVGADNAREFENMFACAVGNYLIGATGRMVPPRDAALKWDAPQAYKSDVIGLIGGLFSARAAAFREPIRTLRDDIEAHHADANLERDVAQLRAEAVVPEKARWLVDRIGRNGAMSPAEKALLRFIAREGAPTDPALRQLVAKVA